MNFFGIQAKAKWESLLLLIVFSAVMVLNALIVHLLAKWVIGDFADSAPAIISYSVFGCLLATVWVPVLISSRKRWRDVRNGGHLLAASYGASYIMPENVSSRQDKELLNVTSEMAIASAQQPLPCFCLRDEKGINAFIIGTDEDIVLVVSQGAIDRLDRGELKAMIAHEYGHIANSDLKINMRLLIALSGLNAMNKFGLEQFDEAAGIISRMQSRDKRRENDHFFGAALYWLFGALFRILGYPLVFSGDVIKSAFSRKREYLADANAIQYTRDTRSLASALHKTLRKSTDAALHSCFANELDHLCFFGPWKHPLLSGLLASHPSPQSRIEQIDPHFVVEEKRKSRLSYESVSVSMNSASNPFEPVVIQDSGMEAANIPIQQLGEHMAIVLSAAVAVSGNEDIAMKRDHERLLKCYTADTYPMRMNTEPGFNLALEKALDVLQRQSAAQRKALLEHIQEIVQQDNIALPEEKQMYEHICARLNPPAAAA